KFSAAPMSLDYGKQYAVTVAAFGSSSNVTVTDFTIDMNPEGFFFVGTPSLSLGPTSLTATFVPAPEPAAGLAAAGLAAAGLLRRRYARSHRRPPGTNSWPARPAGWSKPHAAGGRADRLAP